MWLHILSLIWYVQSYRTKIMESPSKNVPHFGGKNFHSIQIFQYKWYFIHRTKATTSWFAFLECLFIFEFVGHRRGMAMGRHETQQTNEVFVHKVLVCGPPGGGCSEGRGTQNKTTSVLCFFWRFLLFHRRNLQLNTSKPIGWKINLLRIFLSFSSNSRRWTSWRDYQNELERIGECT